MSIDLELPEVTDLKPRLVVIGIGGAGCNAVNNMIAAGLTGVEFVVANTDAQALSASGAENRIQLGAKLTEGLGAGSKPEIGQAAAEEAIEDIRSVITGAHMVFIAAGMGGGTGTGAAATIANVAKDLGILTVGVVTKPFQFEGARRMRVAEAGIDELKGKVDTLIVIPNQNLFRLANERTTFSEAFILADQVLYSGVACIVDLIIKEGLINLDFADVRTVISGMGAAMLGTGEAEGERRAVLAAEEAISNPLLDDVSLEGARGVLLSITGGSALTLYEVDEAASRVREEVDPDANIIVGATFDESLGDRVRVSIVASGMNKTGVGHGDPTAWRRSTVAASAEQAETLDVPAPPPPQPDLHQQQGNSNEAMQQRLSEVLQDRGQQPETAPASAPPASPFAATENTYAYAPSQPPPLSQEHVSTWDQNPSQSHLSNQTQSGEVTIEDGLPPLAEPAAHAVSDPFEPQAHDPQAFQPAVSEPMPRSGRRMPSVEDFPPHAQMEYHQKQNQQVLESAPAAYDSVADQPSKRSLLDRLTGRARGKSDSVVDNINSDSALATHSGSVSPASHDSPDEGGLEGDEHDPYQDRQDADLPMFFGRIAK